MSRTVAIIGAGVVGLCTAHALMRRGHKVIVLERESRFGDRCSFGNGGLVVPSHFEPLAGPGLIKLGLKLMFQRGGAFGFEAKPSLEVMRWIGRFLGAANHRHVERCSPVLRDLNLESRRLYETHYAELRSGYARKGELMICESEETLVGEAALAKKANELGLVARILNEHELKAYEPGVQMRAIGGVYFEDDAHLTPMEFMRELEQRLVSGRVELHYGAEIVGFRREDRALAAITLADGREVVADDFVLAAGAWSGRLAAELGWKMPLLAGKGYGFTVPDPPFTPKYPAILIEARVAVTPMLDGLRFVGTMELGTPKPAQQNSARIEGMRRAIHRAYPQLSREQLAESPVWSGLRPCAPDGMPYLGRVERIPNVVVATGHGMMGMSLGPISGEIVAQIVANEPPTVSIDLMRPERFA